MIVVPYVPGQLQPAVTEALDHSGRAYLTYELDPRDDQDYARMLTSLWEQGDGFSVVEQDVIPPPRAIQWLNACPEVWCYHAYSVGSGWTGPMLGLVRFRDELLGAHPMLARRALRDYPRRGQWCHWRSCDMHLQRALAAAGVQAHRHYPDATHLHDYGNDQPSP